MAAALFYRKMVGQYKRRKGCMETQAPKLKKPADLGTLLPSVLQVRKISLHLQYSIFWHKVSSNTHVSQFPQPF